MGRKEQRQVQDDADCGGGNGSQRRGEVQIVVHGFDQRRTGKDKQKGRQKSKPGDQRGGQRAAGK